MPSMGLCASAIQTLTYTYTYNIELTDESSAHDAGHLILH